MEQSFTTLFKRAPELSKPKKIMLGVLVFPFFLPLVILFAISIPWTQINRLNQRRKERKFTEQMSASGRLMTWKALQLALDHRQGTVIGEYLSMSGPLRVWWTSDDIPAVSPHRWEREKHLAWLEPEFLPFFKWTYEQFTNPKSGLARLVCVPDEERKGLEKKLSGVRFVSTCSFRSVREKFDDK
jgi:hypothetical protein